MPFHLLVLLGAFALACGTPSSTTNQPTAATSDVSAPTAATAAAQQAVATALPLDDRQDFDDATRGLVGREPQVTITTADGKVVWQTSNFAFIDGPAPPSVNPSLWRQAQLNDLHGLFKVTDGVYQVRGYDVSNMSLIRGQSGWIVTPQGAGPLPVIHDHSASGKFCHHGPTSVDAKTPPDFSNRRQRK